MPSVNAITKELLKREGKKKQIDAAQMKETIGHLSDMFYANFVDPTGELDKMISSLVKNGEKRFKTKSRKGRKE